MYRIGLALVLGVSVIMAVACGGSSSSSDPTPERTPTRDDPVSQPTVATPPTTEATSPATEAAPPATEVVPSWAEGGPIDDASVRQALSDADEMIRSLDLGKPRSIQIEGEWVTVTYKAESALKETDLLTKGAHTSFGAHRALFANPRVTSVTIIMLGDWIDEFGAESEDVTTVSTLDRSTVTMIQWDGLEDRVLLDNKHMFCISDAYRIHGGIYSRLGDTGCLTGALRL